MSCEQIEMLLVQYLCDELDEQARAKVAAHLAACAGCAERLGDLRLTTNLLRDALHAGPVPVLDSTHRAALTAAVAKNPIGSAKPQATRRTVKRMVPAWLTTPPDFRKLRDFPGLQELRSFRISRKAALAAACVIITTGLAGLVVSELGSSPRAAATRMVDAGRSRDGRGEGDLSGGTKLVYDFKHRESAHNTELFDDFERPVSPLVGYSKQEERLAVRGSDSDPTAAYGLPRLLLDHGKTWLAAPMSRVNQARVTASHSTSRKWRRRISTAATTFAVGRMTIPTMPLPVCRLCPPGRPIHRPGRGKPDPRRAWPLPAG